MIFKIDEYKNRSNLVRDLNDLLPVYLITDPFEDMMKVEHVSKQYFRAEKPIKKENGALEFPNETWRQRITSGQIIATSLEEAKHYIHTKRAERILLEFDELEKKYEEYKKFKEDYPHYFI